MNEREEKVDKPTQTGIPSTTPAQEPGSDNNGWHDETVKYLVLTIVLLLCLSICTSALAYNSYRSMVRMNQEQTKLEAVSESCVGLLESNTREYASLAEEEKRTVKIAEECADSLTQCVESMQEDTEATKETTDTLRGQTAILTQLADCREKYNYDIKRATLALHQAREDISDCHEEIATLQKRLLTPCGMPSPATP